MLENTIDPFDVALKQVHERSTKQLFDADAALERLDGDVALFATLISIFRQDSAALFGQLFSGMGCGDLAQVERAAHSLKGLAANFDALEATQAAYSVEEMARSGDAGGLSQGISELGGHLEKLRHALAQWDAV